MSHYTNMTLEINDQDCLVKALQQMGFVVEVHDKAQALYGYQGDVRPQKANVIIRRKYVGQSANDIGFERQLDGTYKAWISEYDSKKHDKKWLGKLKQNYGVEKVMKESKRQGYFVQTKTQKNGKVYVTIGK